MSAVERTMNAFDDTSQKSEQQQSLDFLYVKKKTKGFSRFFWSLMGIVSSTYLALILHWHDAYSQVQNTLSHWQHALYVTMQKDQHMPLSSIADGAVKHKPISLPNNEGTHMPSTRQQVDDVEQPVLRQFDPKKLSPKQWLSELEHASVETQTRLTAGNIQRQSQKDQKRVRSETIPLNKRGLQISNPQYLQLYEAALAASESGHVMEANRLVDEALFLKPMHAAHVLKLRLLLLLSVKDVIPYIYKHQLSILESTELLAIYAQANQRSGQHKNAQWAYQKLLQAEPAHEGWYLGLALSLEHLGNVEQAIKYYHQAIQLTQDSQLKGFANQRVTHLQSLLP